MIIAVPTTGFGRRPALHKVARRPAFLRNEALHRRHSTPMWPTTVNIPSTTWPSEMNARPFQSNQPFPTAKNVSPSHRLRPGATSRSPRILPNPFGPSSRTLGSGWHNVGRPLRPGVHVVGQELVTRSAARAALCGASGFGRRPRMVVR